MQSAARVLPWLAGAASVLPLLLLTAVSARFIEERATVAYLAAFIGLFALAMVGSVAISDPVNRRAAITFGAGLTVPFALTGLLSGFGLAFLPALALWLACLYVSPARRGTALLDCAGGLWGFGVAAGLLAAF